MVQLPQDPRSRYVDDQKVIQRHRLADVAGSAIGSALILASLFVIWSVFAD